MAKELKPKNCAGCPWRDATSGGWDCGHINAWTTPQEPRLVGGPMVDVEWETRPEWCPLDRPVSS